MQIIDVYLAQLQHCLGNKRYRTRSANSQARIISKHTHKEMNQACLRCPLSSLRREMRKPHSRSLPQWWQEHSPFVPDCWWFTSPEQQPRYHTGRWAQSFSLCQTELQHPRGLSVPCTTGGQKPNQGCFWQDTTEPRWGNRLKIWYAILNV